MHGRRVLPHCALALVLLLGAVHLAAQEPAKQPSPEEMQEMTQRWQEAMTPGEHHKILDRLVGEWDFTLRVWGMGPGGAPQESHGTAAAKWILGGRFVMEEFTRSMMSMPLDMGGSVITSFGSCDTGTTVRRSS